jgi:hypothetical protein
MNPEQEALDELVKSPGWRVFTDYVNGEWGPAGRAFVKAVADCADHPSDADATSKLRQVIAAQKVVNRMLAWPDERLKQIAQPELVAAAADYSRRGRL